MDFNSFTTTTIISERSNTFSFINSSGVLSEFPDPKLLKLLQDYYKNFNHTTTNFANSTNPV